MLHALFVAAVISLAVTLVLYLRHLRVDRAIQLGFLYDDYLSYNDNCSLANALREYAHHAADLYEVSGKVPPNYRANLWDRGLSTSVTDEHNPYEIAEICTQICKALKV